MSTWLENLPLSGNFLRWEESGLGEIYRDLNFTFNSSQALILFCKLLFPQNWHKIIPQFFFQFCVRQQCIIICNYSMPQCFRPIGWIDNLRQESTSGFLKKKKKMTAALFIIVRSLNMMNPIFFWHQVFCQTGSHSYCDNKCKEGATFGPPTIKMALLYTLSLTCSV